MPGSGGTVTFRYDPFGRRIQKVSSGGTIVFAYDGGTIAEELNAAGAVTTQYTQGQGIDEPLAASLGGTLAFYEADGLGSITSLTDGTGSAVGAYTRDAFGKALTTADTLGNRFRYTGREWDQETGLYYYRARYYDANLGRFLSEDPIKFAGGKNFYKYVANNPINAIDPTGLKTKVIVVYDKTLGITYGSHAAVYIDNGGDPVLYDPFGSYSTDKKCGSGDACYDTEADVDKFDQYHESEGSTVKVFEFDTTPTEEAQIAKNIEKLGSPGYPGCALSVSDAISGIGPFKKLKRRFLPGSLADELQKLQQQNPKK